VKLTCALLSLVRRDWDSSSRPQTAAAQPAPNRSQSTSNSYKACPSAASSPSSPAPRKSVYAPVPVMDSSAHIPPPKKGAVESICNTVTKLDKNTKAKLDKKFDAWKATWYTGENTSSSKYVPCFLFCSIQIKSLPPSMPDL